MKIKLISFLVLLSMGCLGLNACSIFPMNTTPSQTQQGQNMSNHHLKRHGIHTKQSNKQNDVEQQNLLSSDGVPVENLMKSV